jgi:hypothetical protein
MAHSIFDGHSHSGTCEFCRVNTRVIWMITVEGERERIEACGACYREGNVPDYFTALIGCSDCREYAMFFENESVREEHVC